MGRGVVSLRHRVRSALSGLRDGWRGDSAQTSPALPAASLRRDSFGRGATWRNAASGQGQRDQQAWWDFIDCNRLGEARASALYASEPMAGKIVDTLPEDETSEVPGLNGFDDSPREKADLLHYLETRLDLFGSYERASKSARTYGAAAIWTRVLDGRPEHEPVDEGSIKLVSELKEVDRWELAPNLLRQDSYVPETWWVRSGPGKMHHVHKSRLSFLFARELSPRMRAERYGYFGPSELERVWSSLANRGIANSAARSVLTNFSHDVLTLPDIVRWAAENEREAFEARLAILEGGLRTTGKVILAQDEKYEQVVRSVAGIAELLRVFADDLPAVTPYPALVLLNRSEKGLSSGESAELRRYGHTILRRQTRIMAPAIRPATRYVMLSSLGPTGGCEPRRWGYTFAPMWQPSAKELAETRLINANARAVDVNTRILTPAQARRDETLRESYELDLDGEPDLGSPAASAPESSATEDFLDPGLPPDNAVTPREASRMFNNAVSPAAVRGMAKRGAIRAWRTRSGRLVVDPTEIFSSPTSST